MRQEILMPTLSDEAEEGVLVTWFVVPGTPVRADQLIAEVQVEKVSEEVYAPADGRLTEILVQPGEVVRQGAPIAVLEVGAPDAHCRAGDACADPARDGAGLPVGAARRAGARRRPVHGGRQRARRPHRGGRRAGGGRAGRRAGPRRRPRGGGRAALADAPHGRDPAQRGPARGGTAHADRRGGRDGPGGRARPTQRAVGSPGGLHRDDRARLRARASRSSPGGAASGPRRGL